VPGAAVQSRVVEAGDRCSVGGQQSAVDDPQFGQEGQCSLPAAFLQAEQDLAWTSGARPRITTS
jgi:hypothetical protein